MRRVGGPRLRSWILIHTLEAFALAALVSMLVAVPFSVTVVVFLACRPGAGLVARMVGQRLNPQPDEAPEGTAPQLGVSLLSLPAIAACLSALGAWYGVASFGTLFGYALLGGAVFGAINGVVMEWEDNVRGGLNNPTPPHGPAGRG